MNICTLKTGTDQFINCMVDTAIGSEAIAMYKKKDIVVSDASRACRHHECH